MKPKVDLLFILDVTSSMSGMIKDAQKKMKSVLNDLSSKFEIDLKVGLSLYRDHPSQDRSFVTVTFDLSDVEQITAEIDAIDVAGGGDIPEAVIDGIIDGAESMSWREDSNKVAFLIGDAPPHGLLDRTNKGYCLCGKTWGDAVYALEEKNITLYSIVMGIDRDAKSAFKILSSFCGGIVIETEEAMDAVFSVLSDEFSDISIGSRVLELMSENKTPEEISQMLSIDRNKIGKYSSMG